MIKTPLVRIASLVILGYGGISFQAHAQTTHPPFLVYSGTNYLTGGDTIPYVNSGVFGYAIYASGSGTSIIVTGGGGIRAESTNLTQTSVVYADQQARIDLGTGSYIQGEGYNAAAGWTGATGISANNGYITARDLTISVKSDNPYGAYANNNGVVELTGQTDLTVYNANSASLNGYGLVSSTGTLTAENVSLVMDGTGGLYNATALGISAYGNSASATQTKTTVSGHLDVDITGGNFAHVAYATGTNSSGQAALVTINSLTGSLQAASGAYALYANNSGKVQTTGDIDLTVTGNGWTLGVAALSAGQVTLSNPGVSKWNITSNAAIAGGIYASGAGSSVTMGGQSEWDISALSSSSAVYGIYSGAATTVNLTGQSTWQLSSPNSTTIALYASGGGSITQTDSITINATGNEVYGIASLGTGSSIQAENLQLTVTGTTPTSSAVYASGNTAAAPGQITLTDSVIQSNTRSIAVEDGHLNLNLTRTQFNVNNGTAFDVSATSAGATALVLNADASQFTGAAITDSLSQFDLSLNNNSYWDITASSNLTTLLNDHSTVAFSSPAVGGYKTLEVSGNYTGNAANMVFNTELGGDTSPTDLLHIGANATGTTYLSINNAGGLGAQTSKGILLVQVDGTSDANAFTLASPVLAGAYEYILNRGSGADAQNWYLQSFVYTLPPDPDSGGSDSGNTDTGKIWLINPNMGAYHANQYIAATMFNQNILDRRNTVRSSDQTMWIRANHSDASTDLLNARQSADISTSLVQIGADLIDKDSIVVGIYTGYGSSSADIKSNQTGTTATGKVQGYQVGAYLSWLPEENKGPYADVWAYYGWYHNKLGGAAQLSETKYNSTGYSLSAEFGYGIELKTDHDKSWILEPHAQVIYSHVDTDSFYDSHSTRYSSTNVNGWQSRLGARLYGVYTDGKNHVTPFVELNWLYNSMQNKGTLNYVSLYSDIAKNVGEIKLGVQGKLTESLSLWGHMGLQRGAQDYRRYDIQLGLGWQW